MCTHLYPIDAPAPPPPLPLPPEQQQIKTPLGGLASKEEGGVTRFTDFLQFSPNFGHYSRTLCAGPSCVPAGGSEGRPQSDEAADDSYFRGCAKPHRTIV